MTTQTKLPTQLSDLIEVAIEDGRSLDRKRYTPAYDEWHTAGTDSFKGTCFVCLAGAVIAGRLTPDDTTPHFGPLDIERQFGGDSTLALFALDQARMGEYTEAVLTLSEYDSAESHKLDDFADAHDSSLDEVLGVPAFMEFQGWDEFDQHLDSLECIAVKLREYGF